MNSEIVLLEKADQVAIVTLNQPATLNALTPEMVIRLNEVVDDIARDSEVRAVLLTGAGRGFCSGANLLGGIGDMIVDGGLGIRNAVQTMNGILARIVEMEKPWLAAVNGPAVGAGGGLALACDLVLAAESAYISMGFVKIGMALDMGCTFLLPRLVGLCRAAELAFFGDKVYAPEAARIGLINRAVPDDELIETARQWAARLAAGPTLAIGAIKSGMLRSLHTSLRDTLDWEATTQALMTNTQDAAEGIKAFLQKRKPEFKGK